MIKQYRTIEEAINDNKGSSQLERRILNLAYLESLQVRQNYINHGINLGYFPSIGYIDEDCKQEKSAAAKIYCPQV